MLPSVPRDLINRWQANLGVSEQIHGASMDTTVASDQRIICVGPITLAEYGPGSEFRYSSLLDYESVARTDKGFLAVFPRQPVPRYYTVEDDFADLVVKTF